MSTSTRTVNVQEAVNLGGFWYFDYEPRGVPGFDSNIAAQLGFPAEETNRLLKAVDLIEDGVHVIVDRQLIRPADRGSHGKVIPAQYKIVVSRG